MKANNKWSRPHWLVDAMQRAADIREGCLPPACPVDIVQLREQAGNYTSEELVKWNPGSDENAPTICESPYHIIGFTKDGKVAFYGLNHIGTMDVNQMRDYFHPERLGGMDRRIEEIAMAEFEELMRQKKII